MSCGVISSSALRSCCVARVVLQVELLAALAQRRDLPRLEVGLGEDLAVHLDQDLLDDLGAQRRRRATSARTAATSGHGACDVLFIAKSLQPNILPLIEQLAQQAADPLEHARPARADLLARACRISALVKPGLTSPSRARAVHQLGAACDCRAAASAARAGVWG